MINPFRSQSKDKRHTRHIIVDGGMFPIDKEYADLGMRQGWLLRYRQVEERNGDITYYYHYPG